MKRISTIAVLALALAFTGCNGGGDENNAANNGQSDADTSVGDTGMQDAGDSDTTTDASDVGDDAESDTDNGDADGSDTGADVDDDTGGDDTTDADGDGAVASVDCDDNDPLRAPGFAEGCDAIDRDCDGTAAEPDTVSFFPSAGGDPIALTNQLASASLANPAELTMTEDGELRFCEGDFAVGVTAGTHTVTVVGDGQTTTTLEATGGACPIDSEGDLSVRGMTLVGRDSDCLAVIRGHGPTLDVQDVTIRDHEVTGFGASAISIGNNTSATIEKTTIEDVTKALFAKRMDGTDTCVFDVEDVTITGQAELSSLSCETGTSLRNVTLTRSTEGFEIWSNITLDGITINNNGTSANTAKGLMTLRRAGGVVLNNLVVTDNVSDRTMINLSVARSGAGDVTLTNSEFRNNSSPGILGLGSESLSVRDVVVSDNDSGVNQVINVFSEELATAEFHNLTVENNTADRSALVKSIRDNPTVPTFTGTNVFRNNSIDGFGGAIQWNVEPNITVDFSTVTFEGNSATAGGGAVHFTTNVYGEPLTVRGGTFRNNSSDGNGGAIYASSAYLTVEDGTYEGNTADGLGGAVYADTLVAVDGGTFTDNSANSGGAIQGANQIPGPANVTVSNATFLRNSASVAGGVVDLTATSVPTVMGNIEFNACTFGTGTDANTPGDVHLGYNASPSHQTPSNGTGTCYLANQCD